MYAQMLLLAALPALLAGFIMTWILKFVSEYRGREFLEPYKWGTIFGLFVLFEIAEIATSNATGWRYVWGVTFEPLWFGWVYYNVGDLLHTLAQRMLASAGRLALRAREYREDLQFHHNLENGDDAE
jgi:uncharacterized membrane protein